MSTSIYGENSPIEKSYLEEITKKYNYVYLITELSTNKKYIGVRSCDIPIEDDLGKIYISSSTDESFIQRQKENKSDYSYIVLSNYKTREEANAEEIRLHNLHEVDINEEYYNKTKAQSNKFNPVNKAVVKDKDNNIRQISINDPRYLSGELVGINKGMVPVKDKDNNILQVSINDPRYLSGELVHIDTGMATVKDSDGNIFKVSVNDPRYLSKELVGHTKGKVPVKDKNGNMFLVDKNDPRYLSGELIHNMIGKTLSTECKKKISDKNSGNKNRFYGKVHSDEVLNKVSNIYLIEGTQYRGREEVAKKYGINIRTVANRCKSDLFPEWKLIKKRL